MCWKINCWVPHPNVAPFATLGWEMREGSKTGRRDFIRAEDRTGRARLQSGRKSHTDSRLWPLWLKLLAQHLRHQANRLLIAPVPAPLTFFCRLHQPRLAQDRHVMRNRWLRKADAFFNVPRAKGVSGLASLL